MRWCLLILGIACILNFTPLFPRTTRFGVSQHPGEVCAEGRFGTPVMNTLDQGARLLFDDKPWSVTTIGLLVLPFYAGMLGFILVEMSPFLLLMWLTRPKQWEKK